MVDISVHFGALTGVGAAEARRTVSSGESADQ
jgi:hypothetical protein